jgi:hypothetical protein
MTSAIQKRVYELDKPMQMVKMANLVKGYVVKNKLYVQIAGKNYVMVEGWQFAGGMMGLFPRVIKVESIGNMKWLAQVEIVNSKTKEVLSSGFAICSKEENKKANFDEYAILSMAQTRAIGKAYRNLIGWVMKLAGYESTPAEEMKPKMIAGQKVAELYAGEKERGMIIKTASEMGMREDVSEMAEFIEKKTGLRIDWENLTKVQASKVLAELLRIQTEK